MTGAKKAPSEDFLAYWDDFSRAPEVWTDKAAELWASGEKLFKLATAARNREIRREAAGIEETRPPDDFTKQGVMLLGMSIEVALKAALIAMGADLGEERSGALSTNLSTHDLLALARRASLDLSALERSALNVAGYAIVCWGRYPVTKRAIDTKAITLRHGARSKFLAALRDVRKRADEIARERRTIPFGRRRPKLPSGERK